MNKFLSTCLTVWLLLVIVSMVAIAVLQLFFDEDLGRAIADLQGTLSWIIWGD